MKIKRAKVPLLNDLQLTVCYTEDFRDIEKKYNINLEYEPDTMSAFVFELEEGCPIVVINPKDYTHGIIAHECKHAVNILFKECKIKLDVDNDEIECYFLTWVVDFVYKNLPE